MHWRDPNTIGYLCSALGYTAGFVLLWHAASGWSWQFLSVAIVGLVLAAVSYTGMYAFGIRAVVATGPHPDDASTEQCHQGVEAPLSAQATPSYQSRTWPVHDHPGIAREQP